MSSKFTLITSIILTAAVASAGTYYVTANSQSNENPVAEAANQPADLTPVAVAVNKQPNKPIEVIIKTEIVEKNLPTKQHDYVAESRAAHMRPQPQLSIYKD
jgi:Flp pilus assembly protein CpaB